MNRWAEHVDELLNRPLPPIPPYIERAISDFHIDCEKPAREEKKRVIKLMTKRKAGGNLPVYIVLSDLEESVEMLNPLFEKIYEGKQSPKTGGLDSL